MAKVGEGDARWIVTERSDGANVNQWHWTEKDVSDWLKTTIARLFENQSVVDTGSVKCTTTSVASGDYECTVFNRKGKVSFIMDCNFSGGWEGKLYDEKGEELDTIKGKFTFVELDHDTNWEDVQIDLTVTTECEVVEECMRKAGRTALRKQVKALLEELRAQHMVQNKVAQTTTNTRTTPVPKSPTTENKDFTTVKHILEYQAPARELYEALTDEGRMSAYTRSQSHFEKKEGGAFSILNGSISGTVLSLKEEAHIQLKWRVDNWPAGHTSTVDIALDPVTKGVTTLTMTQKEVPTSDVERTKVGWAQNFWEPIKMLFGYQYTWKEGKPN